MSDIQTSTIRVPKNVLEDIKIYCRKAGKPVGEWAEQAWHFLQKNDFDIYDTEATPSIPIPIEVERERNQVDVLCKLMGEFLIQQKQLPPPDIIAHAVEAKATAETMMHEQAKDLFMIRTENEKLEGELQKTKEDINAIQNEIGKKDITIDILKEQIKELELWKAKAEKELVRIMTEQPYIGKIKVNIDF